MELFDDDFWKFSLGFALVILFSFMVVSFGTRYIAGKNNAEEIACVGVECDL